MARYRWQHLTVFNLAEYLRIYGETGCFGEVRRWIRSKIDVLTGIWPRRALIKDVIKDIRPKKGL